MGRNDQSTGKQRRLLHKMSDELKAEHFFSDAAQMEHKGNVFEAAELFRRAFHLDPNVEAKMYHILEGSSGTDASESVPRENKTHSVKPEDDLRGVDLVERFRFALSNGRQEEIDLNNGTHISKLQNDTVLRILKWVVSSALDSKSLEQCSMVSKDFYLCARDPELWELMCKK